MSIMGNMVGAYSQIGKTFIIEDENGNELTGVVTDKEVLFTATDNDVRENLVYASDSGISTGTKVIPAYHTSEGYRLITNGSTFEITNLTYLNLYDFTKLQVIICPYSKSVEESVSAEKVVINENVYAVNSTTVISTVIRDDENKTINLGITNNSGALCLIRYFMYKEIN